MLTGEAVEKTSSERHVNRVRRVKCGVLMMLVLPCCGGRMAARTLIWRNAGPGGGGWIQSIAMDPTDCNTIHVGSDVGGYYQSTDGGTTFHILNRGLDDYFVERIVVDPTDNDIIYLGTQSGVFKSIDGGMNWMQKRNGFPPLEAFYHSAPVGALVMDPGDHRVLYAGIGQPRWMTGGSGHLYKTSNGAASWELLDGIAAYASDAVIHQLAVRPDDPRTLFAATDRGIFKSADGGLTWERKETGLPHRFCRNIAIHALNPSRMYAVMWSTPGQEPWLGGVYRSDDGGTSWIARNDGLPRHVALEGEAAENTCNYIALALDPCDPDRVYVGANSWWGAGLYRSVDGGDHWELCTGWGETGNLDEGWITFWGAAIECVAVCPLRPETVVFGDPGRVMRTDDAGGYWKQIYTEELPHGLWRGNGLEVTCLAEIVVDPFLPRRLYCGYADIGLMVSADDGHSWRQASEGLPASGDVARVVCDPEREGVAWCCEGRPGLSDGCVAMTTNGGQSWEVVGSEVSGLPRDAVGLITLDPNSPIDARRLYACSYGNGVYRSTDSGKTWEMVNNGLGEGPVYISDLVMDPNRPGWLLAARRWDEDDLLGGLYLTQDAGEIWRKINFGTELPDIRSVAVHPENSSVIFVACRQHHSDALGRTFAGGLYRTVDGGQTWQHVFEDRFARCVRISPFDHDLVYVGTTAHPYHDNAIGRGIFVSHDGGDTWSAANTGLTNWCVEVITVHPTDPDRLYVGTGGNGLFVGQWVASEDPQAP